MTADLKKKIAWHALVFSILLMLLYDLNLVLFVVWQSAFTNADVPHLRRWLYILLGAALILLVVMLWSLEKARKSGTSS